MAFFRKAVLASTMIAAGFASTTGAAFAHDHEGESEKNLVNAQGTDVLNQASVCDNKLDAINVVPIDEATANLDLPVLNKTGDGNDSADVPNGTATCNPDEQSGSVDSEDSDADTTTAGATSTGNED